MDSEDRKKLLDRRMYHPSPVMRRISVAMASESKPVQGRCRGCHEPIVIEGWVAAMASQFNDLARRDRDHEQLTTGNVGACDRCRGALRRDQSARLVSRLEQHDKIWARLTAAAKRYKAGSLSWSELLAEYRDLPDEFVDLHRSDLGQWHRRLESHKCSVDASDLELGRGY